MLCCRTPYRPCVTCALASHFLRQYQSFMLDVKNRLIRRTCLIFLKKSVSFVATVSLGFDTLDGIMKLIRNEATEAIAAANRAGCQASTGPVTPAGKFNVRLNGLQHGMRAEVGRAIPQLGEREAERVELQDNSSAGSGPAVTGRSPWSHRWRKTVGIASTCCAAKRALLVTRRFRFDAEHQRVQAEEGRSPSSTGGARLAEPQSHGHPPAQENPSRTKT